MMTRYCLMITSNIGKHTQKHFLGYMFIFVFCFCFLQAKVQYDEYRRFVSHNLTLVRNFRIDMSSNRLQSIGLDNAMQK